jgi:molecular chaperone DnaK
MRLPGWPPHLHHAKVPDDGDRRTGDRVSTGLRARLGCSTLDDLVERFAANVSRSGFFLHTREARPVGTEIAFELLLATGERAFHGRGIVRWVSSPGSNGGGAPGMGIQFTALDAPSRAVVERMVALREKRGLQAGPAALVSPPGPPLATPPPARWPMAPPVHEVLSPPILTPTPILRLSPRPASSAAPAEPSPPRGSAPDRGKRDQGFPAEPSQSRGSAPDRGKRDQGFPAEPSQSRGSATDRDKRVQGFTPIHTPTPTPILSLQSPAQADLSAQHAVQRLAAGPLELDLGLPVEPQPVTRPSRAIIGIDLGTTNSCAAVVKDGKPYVIPSREGYNTVPSIVALNSRHRVVVGHLARAQLLSNPKDTVYGTKRLIGRPFDSKPVQQIREAFAYDIVEGSDGMAAVELARHRLSLEQVSALVLKEVKNVAQNHLGEEVNRAVITVPAYYNERQREAVRRAGALAGLHVERIVNEPTAAALAYAYGRRLRQRVLVYDLGGGTFDASVLELQDNVYEVISTAGDTFLGGVDFDNRIVARLLECYETATRRPFDGDRVALSRLVDAAERAKCALSERREFHIQLPFLAMKDGEPVTLDVVLTRDEIVRLVEPLVERTLAVCREVLDAKGLSPADLDEVILVGGQSRMPLVHEQVQAFFGRAPSRAVHPDEAVAIGAALLAHSLDSAEGVVLIDVLPLSIAVAMPQGKVRTIFERNTPLPSRKQVGLATTEDGQTAFELSVVQGESPLAADCEYLGTVRLDGLPSGPRGMVKIAVGFELGAEGLLTVTARELQTNRVVRTTFAARALPARKAATDPAAEQELKLVPAPSQPSGGLRGFLGRLLGREAR